MAERLAEGDYQAPSAKSSPVRSKSGCTLTLFARSSLASGVGSRTAA